MALCIFIKTKAPRIAWHQAQRNPVQLQEYLEKVRIVTGEIVADHFYRNAGKHCGYCDFLPVRLGDRRTVEGALVQIE